MLAFHLRTLCSKVLPVILQTSKPQKAQGYVTLISQSIINGRVPRSA